MSLLRTLLTLCAGFALMHRGAVMEFSEVLAKRRSVRHFNAKLDVADEDVRALLEAAICAPTAGNIQPWRFTSPEAKLTVQ